MTSVPLALIALILGLKGHFMNAVTPSIVRVDKGTRVTVRSNHAIYMSIKPLIDLALAALMLLVSSPIILICLLLVRLTSRGPAIHAQDRLGQGGRTFRIYNIRTMYQDCERVTGPIWSLAGDPRVTSIGRCTRTVSGLRVRSGPLRVIPV
jgi:lipopolysaccharide/colanic/teichoic acid biosynthesis glycosyltransferase